MADLLNEEELKLLQSLFDQDEPVDDSQIALIRLRQALIEVEEAGLRSEAQSLINEMMGRGQARRDAQDRDAG